MYGDLNSVARIGTQVAISCQIHGDRVEITLVILNSLASVLG